jgi:hypothetical protein
MSKLISVSVERNGFRVSIEDAQALIDGKPAKGWADVRDTLTKPLIVSLYKAGLDQLGKVNASHLNGLSFPRVVAECKRLQAIRATLKTLRCLNADDFGSKIPEDTGMELSAALRRIYGGCKNTFSHAEAAAVHAVSEGFLGRPVTGWDFEYIYNPVKKDDLTDAHALRDSFQAFKFESYVDKGKANAIRAHTEKTYGEFEKDVNAWRALRDLAGDDLPNWGPHKFTSQEKKHGIERSWQARHWAKAYCKAKKLVASEKNKSSVQRLKAKIDAADVEAISQDDWVRVIKASSEDKAAQIIRGHLTAATAASLLQIQTKNVADKLNCKYRIQPCVAAIAEVIASGRNEPEFKALMAFYSRAEKYYVTWELLINHVGLYTIDDFCSWWTRSVD